ncbi:Helicase associated domain protein [Streptomyces sp. NPDC090106]|uniref:DEAD/DEAH box helicase n=1 Tax=Streptomyces sp. NPDC090106 TaxID=3365946 RepID=UPI003807B3BE
MSQTSSGAVAPELWPHQRDAIEAVVGAAQHHARTTVVMPCGTGKTRVGSEVCQALAPGGRVLVVVPTIELVGQTLRAWARVHGEHALGQVVALCSDPGVADERGQELRDSHAAVTTCPAELAALTARTGRVTVVSTYAGVNVVASAHAQYASRPWDVIVVDEAHRTAGAAGKAWALVHDDAALPSALRLYMTATPRYVADAGASGAKLLTVSMDDAEVYGPNVYAMPFSRALELGLLADYKVIVAVATDSQLQGVVSDPRGHFQVGRSALSPDMLARQIAVLRAAAEQDIHRMITYHTRVRDAKWFAKTLPASATLLAGPASSPTAVQADHVYGGQSVAERRRVLDRLDGDDEGLVVVANARVLTEGVDSPAVDGIAFIDPRSSMIDIIQAVGRAMRLGDRTDKIASIVVPVLLGPGEDPAEALEGSAFRQVWRIVRVLRSYDDVLGQHLDAARLRLGSSPHADVWPLSTLPDWLTVTGIDVPRGFASSITTCTVRSTTSSWEEHYGAASLYQHAHGNLDIPQSHVTDAGLNLGQWLKNQRSLRDRLTSDRVRRLDELGINWAPKEQTWRRNLAAAQAYHAEHGHLRVPENYCTMLEGDRVELGAFIVALRRGLIRLDAERTAALNAIGMIWNLLEERWQRFYDAAHKYHAKHENLLVPKDFVTDDDPPLRLGQWIVKMRANQSRQPSERIAKLDKLGMVWSVYDLNWQRAYNAARDYHALHGHLRIPAQHTMPGPDPIQLQAWIKKQRSLYHRGTLSPERVTALERIGMAW